jgi:hypothetical protein
VKYNAEFNITKLFGNLYYLKQINITEIKEIKMNSRIGLMKLVNQQRH